MHVGHGLVVDAVVEFGLDFLEDLDGAFDMTDVVSRRGDDAEHDLALGHNGVGHDGTEDAVVLAKVDHAVAALIDIAREEDGSDGRLRDTRVETLGLEALLKRGGQRPELFAVFGVLVDDFETALDTPNDGHGERFGVDLAAHVHAEVHDDIGIVAADETADDGHGFGESAEIEVDFVGTVEISVRAVTFGTHNAHTVSIVDEDAEVELLFKSHNLVERAEVAFHAVNTLGSHEDAAALLLGESRGLDELLAKRLDVVVLVFEAFGARYAETVDETSMRLAIVDDDVAERHHGVENGNLALVAEVEEVAIFLMSKLAEHRLDLLVEVGIARHGTGTHGISQTPAASTLLVGSADFGIIGEAEVVVKAPVENFFAVELHFGAKFAFEVGEIEIAVGIFLILTERAAGGLFDSVENIFHIA